MAGKYGNIIKTAKRSSKPDDQITSKPDDQITSKPDDQITSKPDDQITSKPDDQITSKPDDQITSKPIDPPKNLCVKVPESWRRHWSIQAKIQGVTMTDVMVEALTAKFGLPEDQITR